MMDNLIPFQLVAIDLDGTLLSSDHQVSDENLAAIQEARRMGLCVILVSARPPFGMQMVLDKIELDEWLVAYNGAYLIDTRNGVVCLDIPISKPDVLTAIQVIRENELYVGYYAGLEWYVEKDCDEMHWERRSLKRFPHIIDLTEEAVPEAHKLIVADLKNHERLLRGYEQLKIALPDLNIHYSGPHSFEVTHRKASKGGALEYLSKTMKTLPEFFVAIGDNYNDLEMFAIAGLSIAMGNAPEAVQAKADWVVPSNDENGVSVAIYRLLAGMGAG